MCRVGCKPKFNIKEIIFMWILNTLTLITLLIVGGLIIGLVAPLINPYPYNNDDKKDGDKDDRD